MNLLLCFNKIQNWPIDHLCSTSSQGNALFFHYYYYYQNRKDSFQFPLYAFLYKPSSCFKLTFDVTQIRSLNKYAIAQQFGMKRFWRGDSKKRDKGKYLINNEKNLLVPLIITKKESGKVPLIHHYLNRLTSPKTSPQHLSLIRVPFKSTQSGANIYTSAVTVTHG